MSSFRLLSASLLVLVFGLVLVPSTTAADLRTYHNSLESRYARAHSLGDGYQFDPRDGWETVNVTNLQYKYRREDTFELNDNADEHETPNSEGLVKRSSKKSNSHKKAKSTHKSKSKSQPKHKNTKPKHKAKTTNHVKASTKDSTSTSKSVTDSVSKLSKIVDSIKGVGKPEPVTITWYAHCLDQYALLHD